MRSLIGTCLLLVLSRPGVAAPDYFTPPHVLAFADSLYQSADYLRAAGEYQRYLRLADASIDRPALLMTIGRCFLLGPHPEKALAIFQQVIDAAATGAPARQARYEMARIHFSRENYLLSLQQLPLQPFEDGDFHRQYEELRLANLLCLHQWSAAQRLLSSQALAASPNIAQLRQVTAAGRAVSMKSAPVAMTLSALLPGAGKLYAGRTRDGLSALLLTSLMGYKASQAFDDHGRGSVSGWIYGLLGAGLYAGNIHGSGVAVRLYNERHETEYRSSVRGACEFTF
jgi:tetratricopeptide (TPR) repeat protein